MRFAVLKCGAIRTWRHLLAGDALYLECALDDDAEVRFSSAEAVAFLRQMRDDGVTIISGHDPESFEYHQKNYNRI